MWKLFDATKLTRLSNGLRVATQPVFGEYCTLGVAIDSGSRYEAHHPPGVCHFVEKLAFSSSLNYPDRDGTNELLERCGALVDCQSTRDTFLYASSCQNDSAEAVGAIIADTVLRPLIGEEDNQICREIVRQENFQLKRNPECEPLLMEYIHQAAFRGNALGFPKYCADEAADAISSRHLLDYLSQFHVPERIVLSGVGVDHDRLVAIGEKYFERNPPIWETSEAKTADDSFAQYTGGELRLERDLSKMALGPNPYPNLAHVVIGFEGVPLTHADFVVFCVAQSLLGGGGSFSAGGPGKGMFSRLYVDVLHSHGWLYNATAFNHSYADTGLFCIRGSAPPNKLNGVPGILLREFGRLASGTEAVESGELERAKVQLKSQLLMNLEMRPVMFEDLARQVLIHHRRKKPQEYLDAIDAVSAADLRRIGEYMLNSKMSLVGYGDLRYLDSYDKIRASI